MTAIINFSSLYHTRHTLDATIHPLAYLKEKQLYPKIFWKAKNSSTTLLGLGEAFSLSHIPTAQDLSTDLPFFGGVFFDPSRCTSPLWEDFSPCKFFVPEILITLHPDKTPTLDIYSLEPTPDPSPWMPGSSLHSHLPNTLLEWNHTSSFSDWKTVVEKALRCFEKKQLDKVVLARATSCVYKDPIDPYSVLDPMLAHTTSCTIFGYLPSPKTSFVGATPEMLYERVGNKLCTESLAGTIAKDSDISELFSNEKLQREFSYVSSCLSDTLSSLCSSYEKSEKKLLKTASLHHLHQTFSGILHPWAVDTTILRTLHPTPAIGGFPKEQAMQFLAEHEPFPRGLYAAPLGWISSSQATLCVAIRSTLLVDRIMTLFAGVGVVEGSTAEKEWDELNCKIAPLLHLGDP